MWYGGEAAVEVQEDYAALQEPSEEEVATWWVGLGRTVGWLVGFLVLTNAIAPAGQPACSECPAWRYKGRDPGASKRAPPSPIALHHSFGSPGYDCRMLPPDHPPPASRLSLRDLSITITLAGEGGRAGLHL